MLIRTWKDSSMQLVLSRDALQDQGNCVSLVSSSYSSDVTAKIHNHIYLRRCRSTPELPCASVKPMQDPPQDRGSPLVQGPASADLSILGGVLRNRVPCFMTSHQVLATC